MVIDNDRDVMAIMMVVVMVVVVVVDRDDEDRSDCGDNRDAEHVP